MLPLHELQRLADAYRLDCARRKVTPRAAEVRDSLEQARRELAQAADAVAELSQHELALIGVPQKDAEGVYGLLQAWAARSGAATCEVDALGLSGRRRWLDYSRPPAKFTLVREIADRLDMLNDPLGSKESGPLYDHAHEALHLANEDESSCELSKVVADVMSARKNRRDAAEVHFLMVAAE